MFRYKFTKKVTFVLIILLFVSLHTYSQDTKPAPETKPLICSDCYNLNAKALVLPKPDYPAAALAVGASGKVDVLIEIDTAGNVVFAKPNSGHPLLWSAAVKAAMNAKFEPVLIGGKPVGGSGLITFNLVQANGISDNGVAKSSDIAGTSVDVSKSGINRLPILNGMASFLPKPIYPEKAKDYCSDGKVEVEVLINKKLLVLTARAISGDELLRESAVTVAKQARFRRVADGKPIILKGILVYNFDSLSKCLKVGIVNKKAISIPRPDVGNIIHPSHLQVNKEKTVSVVIVIDESGNVISARAISGHPLLLSACERSAMGAKFPPTFINPGPLKVKAILTYAFKPNGEIVY